MRDRVREHRVESLAPVHAHHEPGQDRLGWFEVAFPASFAGVLVALNVAGRIPAFVIGFYALASAAAFVMYRHDKSSAVRGAWRTSEAALIGVAMVGGWPGAFLARHLFRHKTRKQPFRTFFWVAVAANCAFLTVMMVGLGQILT